MGSDSSKPSKKYEISHLSSEQVRRTEEELSKYTKNNVSLDKHQFEAAYRRLRPHTSPIFELIQHEERCTFSSILQLADKLQGDSSDQAAVLLRIFGSIAKTLAAVVSIYGYRHKLSTMDSAAMLDYVMLDAPTDESRFDRWLLGNSIAAVLILHVFSPLIFEEGPPLHPGTSSASALFNHSGAIVVNMHLPSDRRAAWTLLFSSVLHGSSFSQMSKRLNGEGPCLVIVQSTKNRTFGCFASAGFIMGPMYHGDATCFLFEVDPQIRIYLATGLTKNYAYLNCQQVSLPNGMGIGGHDNIWPFFLYEDYGKGTSLANISSFEKCHLSGSDHFDIKYALKVEDGFWAKIDGPHPILGVPLSELLENLENVFSKFALSIIFGCALWKSSPSDFCCKDAFARNVEVWRVGDKPTLPPEEEEYIRSQKSVIDKDPGAKAMLEMTGKTMHSDAYRQPAPLLDEMFETKPTHHHHHQ